MYFIFKGKDLDLFKQNGQIVRRFSTKAKIVNAQISGPDDNPVISISMEGGKFVVYKADGKFINGN